MRYYIAGNRGLVGSHMMALYEDVVGGNRDVVDYTDYQSTVDHVSAYSPDVMIINANSVGGLDEDRSQVFNLFESNLTMQSNLFRVAHELDINRILFQGSAGSYPASNTDQRFTENDLYTGRPHDAYMPTAVCKLVGIEQIIAHNRQYNSKWTTAINTNMFGPGERHGAGAHVIGSLMRKFRDAIQNNDSQVEIWGSGNQTRDLIYVKDAVHAHEIVLHNDEYEIVNVSTGVDMSISRLANTLKDISGYQGRLWFNTERPEGVQHRRIDNSRLRQLGWKPQYRIEDALAETYKEFISHDHT